MKHFFRWLFLLGCVFGFALGAVAQPEPAPLSIPLKIWTQTDMNAVNSTEPYWTLDVGGTFLPSSPTANDGSVSQTKEGTTNLLVEGVITDLGTVRILPFQSYEVSLYSVGFLAGKICAAAPPGFQVLIDDQPRNSILYNNSGQTLSYSATAVISVIPLSADGVKPAGVASRLGTGRLDWHVSLGRAKNGDSAGELQLVNPGTQSSWSGVVDLSLGAGASEVSQVNGTDGNSVFHRQYIANEAVADVFTGSNGPEIWFYTPAQTSSSGSPRTFTGDPFVKYKLQTSGTSLTITKETRDVTSSSSSSLARTEVTSITRTGTWPTFTWTVSDWTKSGDTPLVERSEQSTGTESNRSVSATVKVPGGATAASVAANFTLRPWGETLESITEGSGAGNLGASYTYHTNTAFFCHYGYPATKTFTNGSWEAYNYLAFSESFPSDRVYAGIVIERFRPWGNSPSTPSTNSNLGEYVLTHYSLDPFGFPTRPSVIKRKLAGTLVADVLVGYANVTALATGLPLVQATRTESTLGSATQETVTVYFGEDTTDPFFRKKIHSIRSPDGRKTVYAYQRGSWSSPTFTPTSPDGLGAGVASRISVIHGTAASGTLYSTHEGYNIDDVYLVEGKSTLETTIRDSRALVARTELFVWTSSGWAALSSVAYTYDYVGRPTGSTTSTGAVYATSYTGQLLQNETDDTGVKVSYTHDAAGRVSVATREGIGDVAALATKFSYDAAGRVTEQRVGWDQTYPLVTTRTFDTAGQLTAETPPGLGATNYAYVTASRQVTATDPNGNTTIETRDLDGSLLSTTGTGTVAKYFFYGAESDGRQWSQIKLGSSSSPRWEKTWVDRVGRPTRMERPGFTGQANYVEEHFYSSTTGLRTKTTRTGYAATLYAYDALGQLTRSGLDLNANDALDLASNDRITDTDRYFENWSGQWWLRTHTVGYPTADSATSVTLALSRTRLTGLTGGQSEVKVTDAEGNTATTTSTVNITAKTVTSSTTRAGLSGTEARTLVNGLPAGSTGHDGLSTALKYDALLRFWKSIDSRNNATTTTYYNNTNLVQSVTDAAGNAVSTVYYDSAGRTLWSRDAGSNYTRYDYNARGQVLRTWGSGTLPVAYGYDATYGDRLTQSTYRGGSGWTTAVGDGGNAANPWPTSTTGTADTTTWAYDGPSGLLTTKTDANNKTVTLTYNQRGQIATRAWARGVTTTYGYNSSTGELTALTYSDGTPAVSYAYTRWGQSDAVTDVTGTRDLVYDSSKPWRLSAEALPGFYGSRVVTPLYENSGAVGRAQGFQLGGSVGSNSDLEQTWGYTGAGRFDTRASKRASNSIARSFQYGYRTDAALVNTLGVVSGSFGVSYEYAATRDLLTAIDSKWSTTSRTRYDYTHNALAQRATAKQSGDVFADFGGSTYYRYAYNGRGEIVEAVNYQGEDATNTSSPQLTGRRFGYQHDNAGNRTSATRALGTSVSDVFTPNALNQYTQRENDVTYTAGTALTTSTIGVTGGTVAATVGRAGRYWGAEVTLANTGGPVKSTLTVTATTNGSPPLVRTENRTAFLPKAQQALSYDFDGNLTADGVWDYTYDAENRLVAMQTATTAIGAGMIPSTDARRLEFKYDYLGRRVEKLVRHGWNGSTYTSVLSQRRYLYDGWNLVAELTGDGASLLRSFSWGLDLTGSLTATGGVGALLQLTDHGSGASYLPTYDGNGNVAALLNAADGTVAAKYEYSPFGDLLRAEGTYAASNPFRFSTKFTDDESGLVYYGHRYYSPANGRFINRDPIEESGGLNLYGFCGNDSVNAWDLLGMDTVWPKHIVPMAPVFVTPDDQEGEVNATGAGSSSVSWWSALMRTVHSNNGSTTASTGNSYAGGFKSLDPGRDATTGVSRVSDGNNPGLAIAPESKGSFLADTILNAKTFRDAEQLHKDLKSETRLGWKVGGYAVLGIAVAAAVIDAASNVTGVKGVLKAGFRKAAGVFAREAAERGTDFMAGAGRLGGELYDARKLTQLEGYLSRRGVALKVGDEFLPAGKLGGFNASSRELLLRSNPTQYEVWHELSHFRQYQKLGSESYMSLGRVGKEQWVFDMLNQEKRWGLLNYDQQQHAINYILSVGGIR